LRRLSRAERVALQRIASSSSERVDPVRRATALLAGVSNYEDASPTSASVTEYLLGTNAAPQAFPGDAAATGPLAMADVYADGNLDLFVGGRVIPGKYPQPASSKLSRNSNGVFALDAVNSKVLEQAGLVSGAVFADLDGDGLPDLVCWFDIAQSNLQLGDTVGIVRATIFNGGPVPFVTGIDSVKITAN